MVWHLLNLKFQQDVYDESMMTIYSLNGSLLSHLHFQYSSRLELLFKDEKLNKQMWYATMCDGDGELLEQCNIVRALHRIPKWEKLPGDITKNKQWYNGVKLKKEEKFQ